MKHGDLKEKKIQSLSNIWGNIKWSNMHVNGITGGEEKKKGQKKSFISEKIMAEIFPNLIKNIKPQIHATQ